MSPPNAQDIQVMQANNPEHMQLVRNIRRSVFIEEQGVPEEAEYDGSDDEAQHYIAFLNNTPAGTARWRKTSKGIKLERFAVRKPYRNQGVANALLSMILEEVRNEVLIYLHAQMPVVSFYEKAGFLVTSEPFDEAGIRHVTMEYKQVSS